MRFIFAKDTGNMVHQRTAYWVDIHRGLLPEDYNKSNWFQFNIYSGTYRTELREFYPAASAVEPEPELRPVEYGGQPEPNPYTRLKKEIYYVLEKKLEPVLDWLARKLPA